MRPDLAAQDRLDATKATIQHGKLLAWHKYLAAWSLSQPDTPTADATLAKARELSRVPLTHRDLRTLKRRTDYQSFVAELQEHGVTKARLILESRMQEYLDLHYDAIEWVRATGDVNQVVRLVNPIIDRVSPLKRDDNTPAPMVVINIANVQGQTSHEILQQETPTLEIVQE